MFYFTQKGKSHEEKGIVNQDSVCIKSDNGVDVMVVADGVGACKNAEIGSRFITYFMASYACENFDELQYMSNENLCDLICCEFITKYDLPIDSALSTLLLVARKGTKLLFLQVGDGKIILVSRGKSFQVFPDDGLSMYETYTWDSSPEAFCKMSLNSVVFDIDFVLLCTDGVYKPKGSLVKFNDGLSYLDIGATIHLYNIGGQVEYQDYITSIVTLTNGQLDDTDDKTAALLVLR